MQLEGSIQLHLLPLMQDALDLIPLEEKQQIPVSDQLRKE
jgi:hypothetical protein